MVFLAVYVDDILLIGNDEMEIASLKSFLMTPSKLRARAMCSPSLELRSLDQTEGFFHIKEIHHGSITRI